MLTYAFDENDERPLYEQLYAYIAQDIRAGVLKASEKLPSKRRLAQHLGVSVITVENAYAQLLAEGYLYAQERRGYYVTSVLLPEGSVVQEQEDSSFEDKRYHQQGSELAFTSSSLDAEVDHRGSFPYHLWARHIRAVLSAESEESLYRESDAFGSLRLRKALCRLMKSTRGMTVSPDQVVVGAGAQYLYGLVAQFVGAGAVVALENPGYARLLNIYRAHGVEVAPLPLDREGLNLEELQSSLATIAHIMPTHQYPTGLVTTISRRFQLLGWATQDARRLIVEDDYDSEFRFSGKPIPTLQSIDAQGQVLYVNTFTKSLGSGFRIGYLVLPPHLIEEFRRKLGFYSCTVSVLDQLALARFIEEGDYERHISRMRTKFRLRRNALLAMLEKTLTVPYKVASQEAGIHFMVGSTSDQLREQLETCFSGEGVLVHSLQEYCLLGDTSILPPEEKWFVVDYTTLG